MKKYIYAIIGVVGAAFALQKTWNAGCQHGVDVVHDVLKNGDKELYEKVDSLFDRLT